MRSTKRGLCAGCRKDRPLPAAQLCCRCYRENRDASPVPRKHIFTTQEVAEVKRLRSFGVPWKGVKKRIGYRGTPKALAGIMIMAHHVPAKHYGRITEERLRELHARGLSDPDIAREIKVSKQGVFKFRRKLGLPAVGHTGESARARGRRTMARTLAATGLSSLGQLAAEAGRLKTAKMGWPQANGPAEGRILDALWHHGPHTNRELRHRLGLTPVRQGHTALYLASLARRGLIVTERATEGDLRRVFYRLADGVGPHGMPLRENKQIAEAATLFA